MTSDQLIDRFIPASGNEEGSAGADGRRSAMMQLGQSKARVLFLGADTPGEKAPSQRAVQGRSRSSESSKRHDRQNAGQETTATETAARCLQTRPRSREKKGRRGEAHDKRRLLPGGETVVPGGETVVPGGDTVVPGGETVVPGGETVVPGGDTVVPGGDTVVPGGDTVVPGGETVVPTGHHQMRLSVLQSPRSQRTNRRSLVAGNLLSGSPPLQPRVNQRLRNDQARRETELCLHFPMHCTCT